MTRPDPLLFASRMSEEPPRDASSGDGPTGRSEVVIAMVLAALSGFVVGLFLRGEFAGIAICILLAVFCGGVGWWARGVLR